MKKYNGLLVVKTGSQALCKELEQGKTMDLIFIHDNLSCCNDIKIGKKVSKSRKTARYYNKYWRLGILDSDLLRYGYLTEQNGDLVTVQSIEDDLRVVRNKNFTSVLNMIIEKWGIFKMIHILVLYMFNQVLNKFRTFL
jgi:hypothetical protein